MTTEKVHFLYKAKSASPIMQIGPKIILQPRIGLRMEQIDDTLHSVLFIRLFLLSRV